MQVLPLLNTRFAQLVSNYPYRSNGAHPDMPKTSIWHQMSCLARCITFNAMATNTTPEIKDFTTTQKDSPDRLTAGPLTVRSDPFRLATEGPFVISSFLANQTPTEVAPLPYCEDKRQIGTDQCMYVSWKEAKGTSPDVRLANLQRLFHRDDTVLYNSDFVPIVGYMTKPDAAVCLYHKIEENKMTDVEAVAGLIEEHIKNCLGFRENKYGGRERPKDKFRPEHMNWTEEMMNAPRIQVQNLWVQAHPYFRHVRFVGDDGFIPLDAKTELVNLPKPMKEVYNLLESKRKAAWKDAKVIELGQSLAEGLAKMKARYQRLNLDVKCFSHLNEFTIYERLKMFVCPPIPQLAPIKLPDGSIFGYEEFWSSLSQFDMGKQLLALHFRSNMALFTNVKAETAKKTKMCVLAIQATPIITEFFSSHGAGELMKKRSKDGKFIVICEDKEFNNTPTFLGQLADMLECPYECIMSNWDPKVDEAKVNELIPREDKQTYSLSAATSAAAAAKAKQRGGGVASIDTSSLTAAASGKATRTAPAAPAAPPALDEFKEIGGMSTDE